MLTIQGCTFLKMIHKINIDSGENAPKFDLKAELKYFRKFCEYLNSVSHDNLWMVIDPKSGWSATSFRNYSQDIITWRAQRPNLLLSQLLEFYTEYRQYVCSKPSSYDIMSLTSEVFLRADFASSLFVDRFVNMQSTQQGYVLQIQE